MEKLKIGLVGCGRISSRHFEAIKETPEFELKSICDCDISKTVKLKEKYRINCYDDYDKMLEYENLDIVSICTPSGLHSEMGIKAANKKINVITEKPIAIRVEDAENLINECKKNQVSLFVIKQNRLNPTMQKLKLAVDKKRFGRIFLINSTVRWNRTQEYYALASWRGTKELDGGAFLNQASHYVDAVQWFGGEVKSVMAVTKTFNHNIEMEDTGVAILEFKNGAIGTIEVTMCMYRKNWEGSITIIGENGTAQVSGVAVNKITYWDFSKYEDEDKDIYLNNYMPIDVYGTGHLGYYKNIIKALNNKKNNSLIVDGEEALKSLKIICAIYKSSELNRKIELL